MASLEEVYGLSTSVKSFALANSFAETTTKVCYKLGKKGLPYCMFATDKQKEYGVLDFTTLQGLVDTNITLGKEISDYRKTVYNTNGISIENDKYLFYDYLLSMCACYVEIPKYITKDGRPTHTFDKFLATKNPKIMAMWTGEPDNVMQGKYSPKIQTVQTEVNTDVIRMVKLNNTKAKGNNITVPRTAYKVKDMLCIPLYMIYAYIAGLTELLKTDIVRFTYVKDNDTLRVLDSTINNEILRDFYNNSDFVSNMIRGIDLASVDCGGLMLPKHINRGYVKIPEIGSSVYDETGVRSLNLGRLLKIEIIKKEDVDTSFVNIDLNSVVANFDNCIDYCMKNMPNTLREIYNTLTGKNDLNDTDTDVVINTKLWEYINTNVAIFSTSFIRQLHLFIVAHPEWFPLYTGKPNNTTVSSVVTNSATYGIDQLDF